MQARILFTASPATAEKQEAIAQLCLQNHLTSPQLLSQNDPHCLAVEAQTNQPLDIAGLRSEAEKFKIDVNIASLDGHVKKLLIADMDATIIRGESLDELAALAGIGDQIRVITARAMAGELDFEEGLGARLNLLKGQPAYLLDKVVAHTQITPGAERLIATMRAHGTACYLVSGGFTFLTSVIAEKLGFTGHHANQLAIEDGVLAGFAQPPILGKQAKYDFLMQYCQKLGISASEAICVGDGANDMMMLKAAGLGVAFEGKPALRAEIPVQISFSDLSALLYLQGIPYSDFSQ